MTYQTDALSHGIGNSAVSSQWYNRPDDQKFLSLDSMLNFKKVDASRMTSRTVDTHKVKIIGDYDEANPSRGNIFVEYTDDNNQEHNNLPTNWSFGQLSQLAGAPAGYLKDLPAPIAADCIQWGLKYNRGKELIKVYGNQAQGGELRAATGPDYGRIFDWEILEPIKNLVDASDGRWKVPGMMTGSRDGMAVYDPEIPVTNDTTTLFASDRDVFVFLVDDRNPIEVGKLANGEPDLMFRGFYAWNSETGSKTAGIAAMYLRGVCMNRNLWGVENFHEIKIRHTKFAPDRFAMEARPALQSFANGSTFSFVEGVQAAKAAKIASDDEERLEFLSKRAGLSGRMAKAAAARHLKEEGRPVENIWDAAQAITAIARDVPHQDARIEVEKKAGALLDKVTA
tara:strand:+ start:7103 stop:8293 length:1191 start_codon:yes stop_codon:yes gene_type:complete